jgi:hypothetical protein
VKQPSIILSRTHRTALAASLVLAASFCAACESSDEGPIQGPGTGMMWPATTGDAAIGSGLDGGLPPPGLSGGSVGTAGGATGTAGGTALGGTGMAGTTGGTAGAGGTTGGAMSSHDHCRDGYPADPRNSQISSQPDEWKATNGEIDLVLPKLVLDWMAESVWTESHDAWHNIRRCSRGGIAGGGGFFAGAGGLFGGGGGAAGGSTRVDVCSHTELVPEDQECENASDGYQFLVMHRHMMQSLKQAFPAHAELFTGFQRFPRQASDVPPQWQGRWTAWSQQVLDAANRLENIEQNVNASDLATEGDLGRYIQCGMGLNSVHGALHFKWVVGSSPHSLGDQTVNIENYMFWKLHGWIDDVWERYRVAKGLKPDEPKLKQALYDQCFEMHELGHLFDSTVSPPTGGGTGPLPPESGYFHEQVRPLLDKYCVGCHRGTSPEAGMVLGGQVSSASIVSGLVGVRTTYGGQFQRVVAGNPNQSWLYLKVTGMAASAGCTDSACRNGVMPPAGQVTLTSAELEVIRKWIADGAPAPTQ